MNTKIGSDIEQAVDLLMEDQVIGIPTETVYGLAGNSLSEKAVKNIFAIKNRPVTNPLIIHLHNRDQLPDYVQNMPKEAEKLAEYFWPGPLTVLLPKTALIPDITTAGSSNVAVRISNHPVTIALLRKLPFPLSAPSANPFQYISPTSADHVFQQLGGKIPYILDGGKCGDGVESTIIGFENNDVIIYRLGAITVEEIRSIIGEVKIKNKTPSNPEAPGMLNTHYAPRTPLYFTESIQTLLKQYDPSEIGVISFKRYLTLFPRINQFVLSKDGNIKQAAQNLYSALHQMDGLKLKAIIAERMPDIGLGKTINDRLSRAAG